LPASCLLFLGCAHKPPSPAPKEHVIERAPGKPSSDEEDPGFKVQGTLGTLDDDQVSGPFSRRWDDITNCYHAAKSKAAYLGGKVELKMRIGSEGEPKQAYVVSSTIGNYATERCILTIAKELRFSRPKHGSEAEFNYPIEFQGRPVKIWESGRLQPVVQKRRADLVACKKKATQPLLPSSVILTVYVAPGGKVASAGISAEAPLDEQFAACVVDSTAKWKLEDPLGKIAKATVDLGNVNDY
jgi:hypothetical protein